MSGFRRNNVTPALKFSCFALMFFLAAPVVAGNFIVKEDFNNLDNWVPLYFPKIKSHTVYSTARSRGKSCLIMISSASASAIIYKKTFNIYDFPKIKWSWKIENIYKISNIMEKTGDDYPIRLYVIFEYGPSKATFFERVKYNAAKLIYGRYPPLSSLNYVWSSRETLVRYYTSPFTDRSIMIPLEKGPQNVGKWIDENVDVLKDYREVFKKDPPGTASIAVMSDSDNTGQHAVSYLSDIEIYR